MVDLLAVHVGEPEIHIGQGLEERPDLHARREFAALAAGLGLHQIDAEIGATRRQSLNHRWRNKMGMDVDGQFDFPLSSIRR